MPITKVSKEAILQASIRVFRRQGYYRTSMADLAREVGLTKGVFYHHFASKEDLMHTALNSSAAFFREHVFSIAYNEELSGQKRLDKMILSAQRIFTDSMDGCFFANTILETAHVEATFLPEIREFFASWQDALATIFRSKYSSKEANEKAKQLISDIEGSLIMMQLHRDTAYLHQALDRGKKAY